MAQLNSLAKSNESALLPDAVGPKMAMVFILKPFFVKFTKYFKGFL